MSITLVNNVVTNCSLMYLLRVNKEEGLSEFKWVKKQEIPIYIKREDILDSLFKIEKELSNIK